MAFKAMTLPNLERKDLTNSEERESTKNLNEANNDAVKSGFITGKEIDRQHDEIFEAGTYEAEPKHLGRVMYDLRLGAEAFVSDRETPMVLGATNPFVSIKPGEFAILTTHERLKLPSDILGFISLKFTWASRGLINISGFHVDPGYKGSLVFSVYNAGPNNVTLTHMDRVFMIFLYRLADSVDAYGRGYEGVPAEIVMSVKGHPLSLRKLDKRVGNLEARFGVVVVLFGAILAALIGFLLRAK